MAIPASGKLSQARQALEHTRRCKRGYRWRAGIEGRIASLRRAYGWRQSAYHGQNGMERWLGLGVITSHLRRIALTKHQSPLVRGKVEESSSIKAPFACSQALSQAISHRILVLVLCQSKTDQ